MKHFLLFVLLVSIQPAFGQQPAKAWDAATLAKANTAKDEKYLTKQEKEVILYLNLARLNPKLFGETYVKRYLDSTKDNNSYTKSLLKALSITKPMGVLVPNKNLWMFTKEHAIRSGKEGTIGHGNYKERLKKTEFINLYTAENCDYGNKRPIDIVMSLLIDEDIKDTGHRNNILNPIYKQVGTSIQPHKSYGWNCVMDFASGM